MFYLFVANTTYDSMRFLHLNDCLPMLFILNQNSSILKREGSACFRFWRLLVSLPELILIVTDYVCTVFQAL